eukprot:c8679_g1_i2.p1 GENE.c8679_g1_i2~~c8679_g1_i2.p1  ORF type:complete len:331 (+),score=68.46 c8679_g1_i2:41-994(+)
MNKDNRVRLTGTSAAQAKVSAIKLGYLEDQFQTLFLDSDPRRAQPIINRGYCARVNAFSSAILRFMASVPSAQIVSLGAGVDSTYFRLKKAGHVAGRYVDVDMEHTCTFKTSVIAKHAMLSELAGEPIEPPSQSGPVHFRTQDYAIASADLRSIDSLQTALEATGISLQEPTLFVCECLLVYLEPSVTDSLFQWIVSKFPNGSILAYDPISMDDTFGKVMITNFESQGTPLLGISASVSVAGLQSRLSASGFPHVFAITMLEYYNSYLPNRPRIERVEWMDELEEWRIMMSHYALYGGALSASLLDLVRPAALSTLP